MTFIKTLLLGTVLSVTAASAKSTRNECPFGWLPGISDGSKCCPGGMTMNGEGGYCCVEDMRPYKEMLTNTALLYATSTSTATGHEMDWTTEKYTDPCYATVYFTESDYSSKVSSALSKAEATPTDTATTTTGTKTSAGTSSHTSTPTSNAAMPLATADMLSGAAMAAALFML